MREYIRFSRNRRLHRMIAELLDLVDVVLILLFLLVLLYTYVLDHAQVQGSSMNPTLAEGDRLLTLRMYDEPSNGDIVIIDAQEATVFKEDDSLYTTTGLEKIIVKRVIACGEQTVDIDFEQGIVYVDDEPLTEDYVSALTTTPRSGGFDYPITIPEGYVFVLGDNRPVSKDSRYPDVGLVHESAIIGKVLLRTSPLSDFGLV